MFPKARLVAINYDPFDSPVEEVVHDIPGSHEFEFFSIDSTSLKNTHLQKIWSHNSSKNDDY